MFDLERDLPFQFLLDWSLSTACNHHELEIVS